MTLMLCNVALSPSLPHRPPLPESSMEKMKRFRRRLTQTLRGSHTIDESLSELAEQMTIEENGLKDGGEAHQTHSGGGWNDTHAARQTGRRASAVVHRR